MNGISNSIFMVLLGVSMSGLAHSQDPTNIPSQPQGDQPIEKPQLRFPSGAKQSGVCHATFDVKPDGTPDNIQVKHCTDNIYNWPSEVAVGKFKYTPKASWRRNQKTKLSYDLANEFGIRMPVPDPIDPSIIPDEPAIVDSYFGTRKGGRHRHRNSMYCCFDYAVSNRGYAFNVEATKCSSDDAEAIHGSGFDIRSWKFDPAIKNELGISTGGYSDILFYRDGGRVYLGTEDDAAEYCTP